MQALQEGFIHLELLSTDLTKHREAQSYWQMIVAAFLRRGPDLAKTSASDEGHAFTLPRTWDYAIALMASCEL